MTRSAVETRLSNAIVDVQLAVLALVTVDANAGISSPVIAASGAVFAEVRVNGAFVDVLGAVFPGPFGGTRTGIVVDAVDAVPAVLAQIVRTIVDVGVATVAGET